LLSRAVAVGRLVVLVVVVIGVQFLANFLVVVLPLNRLYLYRLGLIR